MIERNHEYNEVQHAEKFYDSLPNAKNDLAAT
jgi:hypothetical protein